MKGNFVLLVWCMFLSAQTVQAHHGKLGEYNEYILDFKDADLSKEEVNEELKGALVEAVRNRCAHFFLRAKPAVAWHSLDEGFSIRCFYQHSLSTVRCLHEGPCRLPHYETRTYGVTAVVFDESLQNVLLVREKMGNQRLKPPTGNVEEVEDIFRSATKTDQGADLYFLNAAAELVERETGLKINPTNGTKVAEWYVEAFRDHASNINYTYLFVIPRQNGFPKDVAEVRWCEASSYIADNQHPDCAKADKNKGWVMTDLVAFAYEALHHTQTPQQNYMSYFNDGTEVLLKKMGNSIPYKSVLEETALKRDWIQIQLENLIASLPLCAQKQSVSCFICYCWEKEICELVAHKILPLFKKVSWLRPIVDVQDLQTGQSVLDHASQIEEADFVAVLATPRMQKVWTNYVKKAAHESVPREGIVEELYYVRKRIGLGKHLLKTLIPVLVEGTEKMSMPNFLLKESLVYRNLTYFKSRIGEADEEILKWIADMSGMVMEKRNSLIETFHSLKKEIYRNPLTDEEKAEVLVWREKRKERIIHRTKP